MSPLSLSVLQSPGPAAPAPAPSTTRATGPLGPDTPASAAPDVETLFDRARNAPTPAERADAFSALAALATGNDPDAWNRAGECMINAWGTRQQTGPGAALLRRAAERGHAGAMRNFGIYLDLAPSGIAREFESSQAWLAKARDAGDAEAARRLKENERLPLLAAQLTPPWDDLFVPAVAKRYPDVRGDELLKVILQDYLACRAEVARLQPRLELIRKSKDRANSSGTSGQEIDLVRDLGAAERRSDRIEKSLATLDPERVKRVVRMLAMANAPGVPLLRELTGDAPPTTRPAPTTKPTRPAPPRPPNYPPGSPWPPPTGP